MSPSSPAPGCTGCDEPVLLTATVNAGATPYVAVSDPARRLFEYVAALLCWIRLSSASTLIFGENSGCRFDFGPLVELAARSGKRLEVLVFDENRGAQRHGKGYGEGVIVRRVLERSRCLPAQASFYKVTGRLFVPEFDAVRERYREAPNVFRARVRPAAPRPAESWQRRARRAVRRQIYGWLTRGLAGPHDYGAVVLTSFYKVAVPFYSRVLRDAHLRVHDDFDYYLEHAFYDALRPERFEPLDFPFTTMGWSGSKGRLLDADFPEAIRDEARRLVDGP